MTANAEILSMSIAGLAAGYRQRRFSPVDVTTACLAQVAATEPAIHAWVQVDGEGALNAAALAERDLAAGIDRGPLQGVPIGIKDIYDVAGFPTRCGSAARQDAPPAQQDAESVAALRKSGAVLLGKTVTQEFAAGVISPPARNPWDPTRIPGGSSGGSAAAIAARSCIAAMGSDTGGSIRIPAAACGVVGFKPTFGQVSPAGVYPLSTSLDTVGPLAYTVADARLVWQALPGVAPTAPVDIPGGALRGVRIGLPGPFLFDYVQPDIRSSMQAVVELLQQLGATVVDSPWAMATVARSAGFVINRLETVGVHEDFAQDHPELFAQYGPDLRLRIAAGSAIPASLYVKSLRLREQVRDSMAALFRTHQLDALIAPATPTTALPADDLTIRETGISEALGASWTRLTMPFNATGQPVLTLPCGLDSQRLPIGLQLAGAPGAEERLFGIGRALETAFNFSASSPPLLATVLRQE